MDVSGIDTQDTAEVSEFEGVFSTPGLLFEVAGQAAVAVRASAEVDAPAERQRGEAFDLGLACGNLELDLIQTGDRIDRGTGVDRIDLGALDGETVLDRPVQDHFGCFGVMNTGGRDNDGQDEAQRATQNMAFDAPDFLVAVVSALPLLRTGNDALRVQEPGRWLRAVAMGLAHPARQIGAGLSPDTVCPEPVIPGAYRLVRTEVARQRSPLAARMLQVKTGIHHLAHIGSEGKVAPEQGLDDTPFRVRQIARIASSIILVFLTIFVCPHFNLLLTDINSPPGESVKQALNRLKMIIVSHMNTIVVFKTPFPVGRAERAAPDKQAC